MHKTVQPIKHPILVIRSHINVDFLAIAIQTLGISLNEGRKKTQKGISMVEEFRRKARR
jgi:hypothetical protein